MTTDIKRRLRLWARENGLQALLAFLVALMIYYYVRGNVSEVSTYSLPVTIDRVTGVALTAVTPSRVDVTLRGLHNELLKLDPNSLSIELRLPSSSGKGGGDGGEQRVRLSKNDIKGASGIPLLKRGTSGIRVIRFDPPFVKVSSDHRGEREFEIAPPSLEGQPLRGHAEVEFTPQIAKVRGARMQLNQLYASGTNLQLEAISIDGRLESFSKKAKIIIPSNIWQPEIEPSEVLVNVKIVQDIAIRDFGGLAVRLEDEFGGSCPTNWLIDPATVTVRLSGLAEVLREIPTNALRVCAVAINPPSTNGVEELPLRIYIRPGATIESAITLPESVKVRTLSESDLL